MASGQAGENANAPRRQLLGPLFADWSRELEALCEKYTDVELAVITDFLVESARRQRDATSRLAGLAADDDRLSADC